MSDSLPLPTHKERAKPATPSSTHKISEFLWGQTNPVTLRFFQICLALATAVIYGRLFFEAGEWLTTDGFHLTAADRHPLEPAPWPLLPKMLTPFFGLLLFGSVICVLVRQWVRIACLVLALLALYTYHVDLGTVSVGNRLFIIGWLVLGTTPAITTAANGIRSQSISPVRILQCTLILLYFTSGIAKWYGDWGKQGDVVWATIQGFYRTDAAAFALRVLPMWTWSVVQFAVLAFELGSPLWFGWKRLRRYALAFGLVFHLGIAVGYASIWPFSLAVLVYYPLFMSERSIMAVPTWITCQLTALSKLLVGMFALQDRKR